MDNQCIVKIWRMGVKKDTRIVESIVLLGVVNGCLYSLKFNPVNAFMGGVAASISELIATMLGLYSVKSDKPSLKKYR